MLLEGRAAVGSTPIEADDGVVPSGTKPAPGKAGRNLPWAIGVGVALAAAFLVSLLVKAAFVALAVVAVAVAVLELAAALRRAGITVATLPVVIATPAILLAAVQGAQPLVLAVLLVVPALLLWHAVAPRGDSPPGHSRWRDLTGSVLTVAYLPFLAGFAVLMLSQPDGAYRLISFVLLVVCNDVGGYTAGVLWGKHPIAPTVSPKKSWEGSAGSAVACAVAGALAVSVLLDGRWWAGVLLGLAVAVAATLGDLAESALKRDIGIKDMSTLLPGHGGLLDRLDSLLLTAPIVYVLLSQLAPLL